MSNGRRYFSHVSYAYQVTLWPMISEIWTGSCISDFTLRQNSCTMFHGSTVVEEQQQFTLLLFITQSAKEQSAFVYNE